MGERRLTVKQSYCAECVVALAKEKLGDVDHDGKITSDDALWILRKVVGKLD